jgi:hypothetical protein
MPIPSIKTTVSTCSNNQSPTISHKKKKEKEERKKERDLSFALYNYTKGPKLFSLENTGLPVKFSTVYLLLSIPIKQTLETFHSQIKHC